MATINAATLSIADITTAMASAVNGDTIALPAGSATWTVTGVALAVTKNLTFQGPLVNTGNTSRGKNSTAIITLDTAVTIGFDLGTTTSYVNNVKMIATNAGVGACKLIQVRGQNVRVSDCWFVATVTKQIAVLGTGASTIPHPTGVTWYCTFDGCRIADIEGDLGTTHGDAIWANVESVPGFGSLNAWFSEDCTCDKVFNVGQNVIDNAFGSRQVVRYCTITDGNVECHGFNSTAQSERGTLWVELYNCTIAQVTLPMGQAPFWVNGGSALCYNNTFTGNWTAAPYPKLDYPAQRFGNALYDGNLAAATGTGVVTAASATVLTDATKSWGTNAWQNVAYAYNLSDTGAVGLITANDGTTSTVTLTGGLRNTWAVGDCYKITQGYPLRDQPGMGADVQLHIGSPLAGTYFRQQVLGCWENNNTMNGVAVHWNVPANRATWIVQDRDYFQSQLPTNYVAAPYPHPLRSGTPISIMRSGLRQRSTMTIPGARR